MKCVGIIFNSFFFGECEDNSLLCIERKVDEKKPTLVKTEQKR